MHHRSVILTRAAKTIRNAMAGLGLLAVAVPAVAAEPVARDWAATTREDVLALDGWLQAAYPAVVDGVDAGFNARWAAAKETALARAAQADDYAGWWFTLYALAATARDAHVTLGELSPPARRRWAGLALERRGDDWFARRVTAGLEGIDTRVPDGARMLACDGEPAEAAVRKRLDLFVTNWEDHGLTTGRVANLFVDRGNPFVPPVRRCTFEIDGKPAEVALRWTDVDAKALSAALAPFRRIKGQRERVDLAWGEDGAAWVTLGNLTDFAAHARLKDDVAAQRDRILAAPYLVFDLRGNGGGDSSLADALAKSLWGEDNFVPAPAGQPKRWRASPFVAETLQQTRDAVAASPNPNPNLIAMADALLPLLRDAIAAGQAMVDDPENRAAIDAAATGRATPRHAAPVFVLTDGGCGSSCILATYMLKRMGAIHAGEPTLKNTMYGEAWVQRPLPSQLAVAVLPVASMPYPPGHLGGDMPDLVWTGPGEDEAGLGAMIAEAAGRR